MDGTSIVQGGLKATELSSMPEDIILRLTLSTKSVILTPSSFIRQSKDPRTLVEIGRGFQGSIFERVESPLALKKEHRGNERLRSNLMNEYSLHRAVLDAFQQYGTEDGVQIPRLFSLIRSTDVDFWEKNLTRFPPDYRTPGTLIQMERVLPLPKVSRRALINYFYPREGNAPLDTTLVRIILENTPNKHCLARPYLGKDDGIYTTEKFSLRNFPLYLKSLVRLGIDTVGLAKAMGKAYAMMHWGAGVNGDDVEFVLGTSVIGEPKMEDGNSQQRAVRLFLLDFGQCEKFDLFEDREEVYHAFKGAMVTGDNQMFIPNCHKSPELFAVFKKAYMDAGTAILIEKNLQGIYNMDKFMAEYEEYAEDFL
ncbi:hypothetical protein F4805DRAFT_461647 [Annulohypoxylon moriforme]|nr:hypothetical protein F4805DRAFT_461647 [Annulohypoxylon moriforme]